MAGLLSYIKNNNRPKPINVKDWKKFPLTDLFVISGSTTTKKSVLENSGAGVYPYVTTQATNNGIFGYYAIKTEKGHCLTVDSAVLGSCFYQEKDFSASDHVEILTPKFAMSKNIALFLSTIINKTGAIIGYSYAKKRSQKALAKEYIYLPAKTDGSPDWEYMEQFIAEIYTHTHTACVNLQVFKDSGKNVDTNNWGDFTIGQLFNISRPIARSSKNYDTGSVPFVASGNVNNGIESYVNAETEPNLDKGNCITVSPLDGTAFYQEHDFAGRGGAGSSIIKLYNDNLNKYNALFICTILRKTCNSFCYSKMLSADKLANTIIKLPTISNTSPDWKSMENFIKKHMHTCYAVI